MRTWIALVGVVALAAAGCGSDSGPHRDGARTYYESLDFSSPEAAVDTFTDAFARDDFMTVWLGLGQFAQARLTEDISLLQFANIIDPRDLDGLRRWWSESSFEDIEILDQWFIFDRVMLFADDNGDFIIDLSGKTSVLTTNVEGDEATVMAEVEGLEGPVEFRLRLNAADRWRINSVRMQGGSVPQLVWPGDS